MYTIMMIALMLLELLVVSSELILPSEPNSLIMWPSNFIYQHAVKPVTEGERYSVVSWIR